MVDYDKPLGISLMAFLIFALVVVIMSAAVYVFLYESEFWDHGLLQVFDTGIQRFIVVVSFSVLSVVGAIGLLKTSPGGRKLILVLCLISIVHGAIIARSDLDRGLAVLGICALVLLYNLSSSVSAVFKPMDSRKAVESIEVLQSYRRGRSLR